MMIIRQARIVHLSIPGGVACEHIGECTYTIAVSSVLLPDLLRLAAFVFD